MTLTSPFYIYFYTYRQPSHEILLNLLAMVRRNHHVCSYSHAWFRIGQGDHKFTPSPQSHHSTSQVGGNKVYEVHLMGIPR